MSGAVAAAGAGAAVSLNFSIVTGTPAGGFGYDSGGAGTLTPSTLKGVTITNLQSVTGVRNLTITLNAGSLPQSFFTSILVVNSAGNFVNFSSASASYTAGGINCIWSFGDGSAAVWNAGSLTRAVIIFI